MNDKVDVDLIRLLGEQLVTIRAQAQEIQCLETLNQQLMAELDKRDRQSNMNAVPLPVKNFGKEEKANGES